MNSAEELEAALQRVNKGPGIRKASAVIDAIEIAERLQPRPPRGHLGYSEIGETDNRTLWLKFRWCLPDVESGRLLRLFRLGDLLEADLVRVLNSVGTDAAELAGIHQQQYGDGEALIRVFEADPRTGRQFNFADDLGGHFAGSLDGIAQGVPDCPSGSAADWVVLEFKSAKADRFREFERAGVKATEVKYWAQVQCYMHKTGLSWALFIIYNKDTSELYAEWVERDAQAYWGLLHKAEEIIASDLPPESRYPSRDWYEIKRFKSADYQRAYWLEVCPPVSCRTCRYAGPVLEGRGAQWLCAKHNQTVNLEQQLLACEQHRYLAELVPLQYVGDDELGTHYADSHGVAFINSDKGARTIGKPTYSSAELRELSLAGFPASLVDGPALEIRDTFNASLIEAEKIEN